MPEKRTKPAWVPTRAQKQMAIDILESEDGRVYVRRHSQFGMTPEVLVREGMARKVDPGYEQSGYELTDRGREWAVGLYEQSTLELGDASS